MTNILYIKSHLGEKSTCNRVADIFIENYQKINNDAKILKFDLNNEKVGKISLNAENFSDFWQQVNADFWINQLKNAKKVIISTPIINWGYTAQIKNFFDAVCLADKTFSYKYSKKDGAIGLLDNIENVQIIISSHSKKSDFVNPSPVETIAGTFKFLGAKKINSPLIIEESHRFKDNEFDQKTLANIENAAKIF
ncbi:FMN-dependent NADH-azoreductase [Mycoplasma sp. 'Moose RK']|uniref:FMN-dependent NADH-azoreductase n=1 Tax=Mycoplasma sp. 'Moose RK' TaxID=2780095 RepID=UPI0018C3417E|nr:FMN-dependent NADH-azoreductase [Mycoplasma sp. 'Moose RK']MBG0730707.1 FMN-dependent NADH-azoreductase [Mycoplasma sp. 'Moose RK']